MRVFVQSEPEIELEEHVRVNQVDKMEAIFGEEAGGARWVGDLVGRFEAENWEILVGQDGRLS